MNVLTGEIHDGTVGVKGDRILGFGDYRAARKDDEIDLGGAYVAPALWDAHLHIESTMTTPATFARLAAAHGTAAAITDPHEIANVKGVPGIRAFLEAASDLPVDVFVMLPSCVPSTHLETAGATLSASDLAPLYDLPNVLGLAEMMNVPGFLFGDPGVAREGRGRAPPRRPDRRALAAPLRPGPERVHRGRHALGPRVPLARRGAREGPARHGHLDPRGDGGEEPRRPPAARHAREFRALRLRDGRPPPVGPPDARPPRPPRAAGGRSRPRSRSSRSASRRGRARATTASPTAAPSRPASGPTC